MKPKRIIPIALLFTALLCASALAYVGNSNSMKFHYESCRAAQKINAANQVSFDSRDDAIAAGYTPCGICRP